MRAWKTADAVLVDAQLIGRMPPDRERPLLEPDDLPGLNAIHAQEHRAVDHRRHRGRAADVRAAHRHFHRARLRQEAAVGK